MIQRYNLRQIGYKYTTTQYVNKLIFKSSISSIKGVSCNQIARDGQNRSAKTLASSRPVVQGVLPKKSDEPLENVDENEGPAYPTVMQQALNNMRKFPHCVLLTKVGSFYELYFHQAEEYAPLLGLKLATKKTSVGPVAFSGFPYFQKDRYLKVLVQDMNKYVAMSEEIENDPASRVKSGGLLFDRRIDRIITPGTLIDERFMDPWENNFLLSIHLEHTMESNQDIGLAWVDLSSGDFFTQKVDFTTLPSALARIRPREIVVDKIFEGKKDGIISSVLGQGEYIATFHDATDSTLSNQWETLFDDLNAVEFKEFSQFEVDAGTLLLQYIDTQLLGKLPNLRTPVRQQNEQYMMIDKNSINALEIRQTLKDGAFEGSLLHTVRRTVTKSGSRLLSQRLISPSASLQEINQRLDIVTEVLSHPDFRQELVGLLRTTFDTWRLLQKFSFGKGIADDLLALARTIQATLKVNTLLDSFRDQFLQGPENSADVEPNLAISRLQQKLELENVGQLANEIFEAIDEDKLAEQHSMEDQEVIATVQLAENVLRDAGEDEKIAHSGMPVRLKSKIGHDVKSKDSDNLDELWIMRTSASEALNSLHENYQSLLEEKQNLQLEIQEKAGTSNLLLKWSPGLGHYCHYKGKSIDIEKLQGARKVSQSRSTASLHLPEWTELGGKIEKTKNKIRDEEHNIFIQLRDKVIRNLVSLRRNASVLDELDVACSFASIAHEQQWTRPVLNHGTEHHIIGGRHPTVESGLKIDGRQFTSNDLEVGGNNKILIITGPNMAGKSTFLRQSALISILAQIGSYVPADYAAIGIVDKLFSRVGSADNLYQDQSTFMVEMLETAQILKQATPRSFVIMDEVGRGTTPEDGIAVGYAALHHLYHVNQSRALFATHFHVLTEMTASWNSLACYCTDVIEHEDGGFSYVHKLRSGVNRQSHALKVARLAGLPEEAIRVARSILVGDTEYLQRNTERTNNIEMKSASSSSSAL